MTETVWIVEWISAEKYSDQSGIEGVFTDRASAMHYIRSQGKQPIGADPDEHDEGCFLRDPIEFPIQTRNNND